MFFLSKKHLSRRTLLKGAGASVALPLLDAMVPAATALANTAAAPKIRAGFFYIPHGAVSGNTPLGPTWDKWTPSGSGESFKLNHINEPLDKFKKYVTSFGNLENAASANSVHVLNPATWLSCTRPDTSMPGANMATTIDQIIAAKIGQETALPSMELASETTIQGAACGGGVGGCYYSSTLSFRNAHSPLPMEYNPRKVFIQIFGEGDTAEERAALSHQTKSLLDLIADRTKSLQKQLSASDQAMLSNYLESVREIERRVEKSQSNQLTGVKIPKAPIGELENFDAQVKLVFDLIALAYQADISRVISYMMVSEGTNRSYNHIGVADSFHPLSHHANDPEKLERLVKIQRYHVERFADFIAKLASIQDGEGTLLDHSLFLYGSNMSNSDRHNNYPLPALLVGGGNGTHQGGKHIVLPEHTPLANLHLTILNKFGINEGTRESRFADSTGMIESV